MGDWDSWLGRTVTQHDRLTPALLQRYRATVDSDESGDIAPQAVHWIMCTPQAATAQLAQDGHPLRNDSPDCFIPPIPLPRRMWASSKVEFLAPIAVDAEIERCSTIASISEKEGSSGRLVFVDVEHRTRANGALVVQEMQTIVYREATSAKASPNETLLFRYSALTFNSHRIHYDRPYATGEEGYRGLVVHGPLIASLLLDLAGREFGPNALKAFNFRAQSPAFANEALYLVGNRIGETVTLAVLGHDGRTCMSAEARL